MEKKESVAWEKRTSKRKLTTSNMHNTKSFVSNKELTEKKRKYLIHDNEKRPYQVVVDNTGLYIYTYATYEKKYTIYSKLLKKVTNFKGYWRGYDPSPYAMHGNSILVQLSIHKYLYVGQDVYTFSTSDEIKDYVSPIGKSDVPYPVAYGVDNVYFMIDNCYVHKNELETPVTVKNAETIYGEFYGIFGKRNFKAYSMKNLDMILLNSLVAD
uniref:Uncharacterized protein n=1 Tax=viral metagenome TaxID=1070528 RepID=A0A6C0C985_9ZZZZ